VLRIRPFALSRQNKAIISVVSLLLSSFALSRRSRTTAGLIVAILFVPSGMMAQEMKPTLDVGTVTLSLGLSLDAVHQQLEQAGYRYIDSKPNENGEVTVIVTREDTTDQAKRMWVQFFDNDGELRFRGGSLIIMRKAQTDLRTDRDLAESLYALVRQYEREGGDYPCSLSTQEETHPETSNLSARQVTITCQLGTHIYRSTVLRLVTDTHDLRFQPHVTVWLELWRPKA